MQLANVADGCYCLADDMVLVGTVVNLGSFLRLGYYLQ